ncbi:MAG: hypothetical protein K9K88_02215 [Desulfobacterales bacterium]|nr:hypothetical protein [Desulfobacterales bacterium]
MNIKKAAVFLVTSLFAIFMGFSTVWAGDPISRRDRYVNSKPGKFQGRIVERNQHRQAGRIHHGVRSGQITRPEAYRLKTQQQRIDRTYRRFSANRSLDRHERSRLGRMQHRASRHIHRAKHNHAWQHRHFPPRHFGHWKYPHPGYSRFSAGVWDSGWRFAFSIGGR